MIVPPYIRLSLQITFVKFNILTAAKIRIQIIFEFTSSKFNVFAFISAYKGTPFTASVIFNHRIFHAYVLTLVYIKHGKLFGISENTVVKPYTAAHIQINQTVAAFIYFGIGYIHVRSAVCTDSVSAAAVQTAFINIHSTAALRIYHAAGARAFFGLVPCCDIFKGKVKTVFKA